MQTIRDVRNDVHATFYKNFVEEYILDYERHQKTNHQIVKGTPIRRGNTVIPYAKEPINLVTPIMKIKKVPMRFWKGRWRNSKDLLPAAIWIEHRIRKEAAMLDEVHQSYDKVASTMADFIRQINDQPD